MLFGLFRRRGLRADVASLCERGLVRAENQDHVFVNRRGLVFCVADGMGGGQGGGAASEIVCRAVAAARIGREDFETRVRRVDEAIRRADGEVRAYAAKAGFRQMGSTAAVLVADGADAPRVAVGNVGDSRVYLLRRGELRLLTRDHTVECELRGASGRGAAFLSDAHASALSHVLTRAVGVGPDDVRVDWTRTDLCAGDVFLVCSDGVHGVAAPERLRTALAAAASLGRARAAVAQLRETVLAHGAPDNFSAVVVGFDRRS